MRNALLAGFGGPMGRFARPAGRWFNPLLWSILVATLLFLVLTLRQLPCIQTSSHDNVDAFIRLCYSDISVAWTSQHFGEGALPLGSDPMLHPPLLGLVLLVVVQLTKWLRPAGLTSPESPGSALDVQLEQAQVYFGLVVVVLFVSFLVLVVCVSFLGRDALEARRPTWDGMLVAASPVVLASGLISYDLLAIALCALGLLQFARSRPAVAGLVLGLAAGVSLNAVAVILAVALTMALRTRVREVFRFLGPAAAALVVVHLPLLLTRPQLVLAFHRGELSREAGYGSLLFAMRFLGWEVRAAGSLGFMLTCLALVLITTWLYLRRLRPRVGTVVGMFLFTTLLLGASFGPQAGLWLLFALVLAAPRRPQLIVFTVTQVLYWLAVWGYLSHHLTLQRSGNPNLYLLALLLRVGVEVWILIDCLRDAAEPGRDTLRTPDVPDPIGGILNDGERLAGIDEPTLATVAEAAGIPGRHRP